MSKRTHINDFRKVEKADDLERVVKDKRERKRANKQKATQRNRRYEKRLLEHLRYAIEEEE